MKKLFLFILFSASLHPIHSQSSIKFRSNLFKFNDESESKVKLGFGLGHQFQTYSGKWLKLILSDNLDFKHTNFYYYSGGLGAGAYIMGNINFLNVQIDMKARFGKQFFGEIGVYSSLSITKYITKGEVYVKSCSLNPFDLSCNFPKVGKITTQSQDFSSFDGGLVVGTGFLYKQIAFVLDVQLGLYRVLNLKYYQFKTQQLNLSAAIPFEKLKKKERK